MTNGSASENRSTREGFEPHPEELHAFDTGYFCGYQDKDALHQRGIVEIFQWIKDCDIWIMLSPRKRLELEALKARYLK